MRHNLLSSAIPPSPGGMDEATAMARLVAPAGGALCAAPGFCCTTSRAVDLAAVAAATDEHLHPGSARTERSAPGLYRRARPPRTDVDETCACWDTAPAFVPRTDVGRGADANFQVWIGAVPALTEDGILAQHVQSRQPRAGAGLQLADERPTARVPRTEAINARFSITRRDRETGHRFRRTRSCRRARGPQGAAWKPHRQPHHRRAGRP